MTVEFAKTLPRNSKGAPLVRPPDGGDLVEYVRCSKFGELLEDQWFLERWKRRLTAKGAVSDAQLMARLIQTDATDTRVLDNLGWQAFVAGGGTTAADAGTELHAWAEKVDLGECDIDDVPDTCQRAVQAYRDAIDAADLEIVPGLIECILVNDDLRASGTADRIVRHRPTGRLFVLDLKGGKKGVSLNYAVQLACYAGGVLYDPVTEERTVVDIDRTLGIIAHVPAAGSRCKLIAVDLEAIRPLADMCAAIYQARALDGWHQPFDPSSLSSIDADPPSAVSGPTVNATGDSSAESLVAPSRGEQLAAVPDRIPDDGDTLPADAFNHVRAIQATLNDQQKTWVRARVTESINAQVSIHTSAGFTARRLAAIETLLASATRIGPNRSVDDVERALRNAIADTVDADWPKFANVRLGHALGVLHVDEVELIAKTLMVLDDTGWHTLAAA